MAPKIPSGSASGGSGGRPRAQVAYEGEDEFSAMSLEPGRRDALRGKEVLAPGSRETVKVDDLVRPRGTGLLALLRRLWVK